MAAVTKVGVNHCDLTVTGTVISMGVSMLFYLHEPLPEGSGNRTCNYLPPRAIGSKTTFETAFHDL